VKKILTVAGAICAFAIYQPAHSAPKACGPLLKKRAQAASNGALQIQDHSSNPFVGDSQKVLLNPANSIASRGMDMSSKGGDLTLMAYPSGETAQVEWPVADGQVDSIFLPSDPSRLADGAYGAPSNIPYLPISKSPIPENAVIREYMGSLYGFSFLAKSENPGKWRMVLTTEVSEKRSAKLGGRLTYEAEFDSPANQLSYVSLTTANFASYLDGKLLPKEPSLGDPRYAAKTLNIKSMGFSAACPATASSCDLRIHRRDIGMGVFMGLSFEEALAAIRKLADLETDSKANALRIYANLLERMKANMADLPEGKIFRSLKTEEKRIKYITKELGKIRGQANLYQRNGTGHYLLGRVLTEKIGAQTLWADLNALNIPREEGEFGEAHGVFVHALQIIAMLKNASDEEIHALYVVFLQQGDFELRWILGFDSRTHGANDPALWRDLWEPPL
jgi:hypothetical protein